MSGGDAALRLGDLVDVPTWQSMMDDFYQITRIPMSLIDSDGLVVVGAGWQEACTRFHRVNAESCAHCIESDTALTADIPAEEAKLYKCKNGMLDAATPIFVSGKRVGNLFTGQFFFDDESVDMEYFRTQARRYGFPEDEYLASIASVPRLGRATVDVGLSFLTKLSSMISQLTYGNMERERARRELQAALAAQTALTAALAVERGVLQAVMENTDTCLAYLDPSFTFIAANSTYARGAGYEVADLIGRNHFDLFPNEENESIFKRARETGEPVEFRAKPFEFVGQPWRGVTYWDWRLTPVKDRDGTLQGFAFSLLDVTRTVRQKAFSDAINQLNDVIHANLDFGGILAKTLPQLAAATRCEVVAAIMRSPAGPWESTEAYGLQGDVRSRVFGDEQLPEAIEAIRSGRPFVVENVDGLSPKAGLAVELGLQSALVAPLSVPGRLLGVVAYGYLSGPGEFDALVIDFAAKIAASLSLALNNARLYEGEHRVADQLQEALLALPSSIEGIDFAHAYHSASQAARVGGDFYDVFEMGGHHVGITIGDVAGKGLDAAVLTSLAKNTIRAHASERGKTPSRILTLTNDVVFRASAEDSFVTLFFGILNCENGTLVYANAGHPSPAVVKADCVPIPLAVTGPILGAFEGTEFAEAEAMLNFGDVLFLYTDGLTEARLGDAFYGEERVFGVLPKTCGGTLQEIVEDVIGDVFAFAGGHLTDDLAILVVKRARDTSVTSGIPDC